MRRLLLQSRRSLLTTALLVAFGAAPANARLQLSINANGSTFSCFDGQLGCDQSGGANNLLVINTTIGGAFVELALAQSSFGSPVQELQLSSSNILNLSGAPIDIKLLASDTNFIGPVSFVQESASLTFNRAIGSPASTLQFWADPLNTQGANPTNTPGTLLDTVNGTPTLDPDSFSGTHVTAFNALTPFSMTEGASLNLVSGASVTGFNQSMQTGVPEASTWAMLAMGFMAMAFGAVTRKRMRLY